MYKVFVDGNVGTTGLQVVQRLKNHPEVSLLTIDYENRKDDQAKLALMAEADVTVLCLPDDAAIKSAHLANTISARVLDASTAHRVAEDWVFGLPEMSKQQRHSILSAQKVSNPGCYPTGAILLLRPIVEAGLNIPFNIHAVTGFSGGGNKMIENYQSDAKSIDEKAYALYGLGFDHKHIPEIVKYANLDYRPTFFPAVVNISQGMMVQVAIHEDNIPKDILQQFIGDYSNFGEALFNCYQQQYENESSVNIHPLNKIDTASAPFLHMHENNGSVLTDIYPYYHPEYRQALLVARFDNLGKGASGAAVQNINIMLGLDEHLGVSL